MPTISVVINTRNEEENLPRALKSVKSFADEIVVVDMESTDDTVKIAKKAGAKVFNHKLTGIVEPARNFAISKATGDWILILDADEEIGTRLPRVLKELAKKEKADYYRLPRKNIVFGKWMKHSRWWPDHIIRFFKKGKVEWSEIIHSVPTTIGKGVDLEAEESNSIIHHHYKDVEQFINRMNIYTTKQSEMLIKSGYIFDWRDLVRKPVNEFLSRFFFGNGYKDGIHGLALASLQACSEATLYLKVWQAEKFREQDLPIKEVIKTMKTSESDIHYWQADALLKEHGGVINRIKRKLRLR